MKKIPDITEQALKKALGELERSIRGTKREARATDERIAAMDAQRAQLADEVAAANHRSDHTALSEDTDKTQAARHLVFGHAPMHSLH